MPLGRAGEVPGGCQAPATVKLGETTIMAELGQLRALQSTDKGPGEPEALAAGSPASRNPREVCTQMCCSRKGPTDQSCGCRGRLRVSDRGHRAQETGALSQTVPEALRGGSPKEQCGRGEGGGLPEDVGPGSGGGEGASHPGQSLGKWDPALLAALGLCLEGSWSVCEHLCCVCVCVAETARR